MNLIKKAKSSQALKQTSLMIVGNTLASGIAAIALIIYSRILGPEKYGIFSIGFSAVLLISKLADGGINVALQRSISGIYETKKEEAKKLITVSTRYKLFLSFVLILIFLIISEPLATHWLKTEHVSIVRAAIVIALVNIAYDYIAIILQSVMQFKDSVIMNISQAVSKALVALGVFLLSITNPLTVFIIYASSPLVGIVYGFIALPSWIRSWRSTPSKIQYKAINNILKYTSIAVIVGAVSDNIDVLMVKSFLTNYDTGLYSAGARLSLLISILGYSLGTVLNPRVARYKSKSHFKKYISKAILISGAALVGSLLILPLSRPLILLTAGSQYLEAVGAVKYLLSAGFIVVATTPFVSMFYVLEKTQYFAIKGIIQAVVLISSNLFLIPQFGIVGAGMARLLTRIIIFIFTAMYAAYAIRQHHQLSLTTEIKDIGKEFN